MASAHKIHDTCRSQAATHTYSFGDVWHCAQQSNCSCCILLLRPHNGVHLHHKWPRDGHAHRKGRPAPLKDTGPTKQRASTHLGVSSVPRHILMHSGYRLGLPMSVVRQRAEVVRWVYNFQGHPKWQFRTQWRSGMTVYKSVIFQISCLLPSKAPGDGHQLFFAFYMLMSVHSKSVYGCPFFWKGPEAASSILCRILSRFFLTRLVLPGEGGASTPRRPLMHNVSLHANVPFHNLNTALSMLLRAFWRNLREPAQITSH
jgi:hypothetical protein